MNTQKQMMKYCESCGIPMTKISDFGGSKPKNNYCSHCTDEHGELKSFDSKLEELTLFVKKRLKVDEFEAQSLAAECLFDMPAWKNMKAVYASKTKVAAMHM